MAPSRTADKFMLRMPDGMRDYIADRARATRRSMNAEILVLLESAIGRGKATTGEGFADTAPAVASNETALQGGPITHG